MKKIALLMILALALCATTAPLMAGEEHAKSMGKMTKHDMTVEVISADTKANTITVKGENGEPKTVPVMGDAVKQLAMVKPGSKIMVTCMDNEKGEHQGVSHIKTEMAKTEKK